MALSLADAAAKLVAMELGAALSMVSLSRMGWLVMLAKAAAKGEKVMM